MKAKQVFATTLSLSLMFAIGSADAQASMSPTGQGAVYLPVQGTVGDTEFPSRDRSYLRKGDKGAFVNVDNLRQMKAGLSKQQVRALLGAPHFSEGLMGVSRWNYIFNFRTGVGDEFITCQYQVNYGKDPQYNVRSMHWDNQDCLALLNRQAPQPVVVAPPQAERVINLSADALFRFNRSNREDLLPKGLAEVEALVPSLLNGSPRIRVVGFTDRLGSDAYNQSLSERRAATVRNLLIARGVAPESITSEGRGESEPMTTCSDSLSRAALVECLQPDRRVQIIVQGAQVVNASN